MALDAVELTSDLIRCPSVTPIEGGALDYLQKTLEGLGFICTRMVFSEVGTADVDNLYARLGNTTPNLCFAGHTDVVPVGDASGWSEDPFGAVQKDGVLYGRGTVDMKGAIGAWIAAISRHLDESGAPAGSLSLLITGDEEGPSINGTRKMLGRLVEMGDELSHCITGEPSNPDHMGQMMKIGRRGSVNFRLTVNGMQGHVGYPHLADNPIHRLSRICTALADMEIDQGSDHFQASTLSLTTFDVGNETENIIPASAVAKFNIRFNDLHTSDDIEALIVKTIEAAGGVGLNYEMKKRVSGESFLTQPGFLSELVGQASEAETGVPCELSTTGGTSDSRFIKDYCPVLDFGLVGKTMHKVDEQVALADIETLTNIYTRIITGYFKAA